MITEGTSVKRLARDLESAFIAAMVTIALLALRPGIGAGVWGLVAIFFLLRWWRRRFES